MKDRFDIPDPVEGRKKFNRRATLGALPTTERRIKPPSSNFESRMVVCVRVRPLTKGEQAQRQAEVVHADEDGKTAIIQKLAVKGSYLQSGREQVHAYTYDSVFSETVSQEDVFINTAKPLIPSFLDGINSTVFAYGATGAGKTHTMIGNDDNSGIIPRTFNEIFKSIDALKASPAFGRRDEINLSVSYLEVYNEMIRDLLTDGDETLQPREDPVEGEVIVAGLTEINVNSCAEVTELLNAGNLRRKMEPTAANEVSSRSHAVLQIIVKRKQYNQNDYFQIRGRLSLIDLAGSERASRTENRGERLQEGAKINQSLLALANCINALTIKNKSEKPVRVKYRDSKLTHLLKSSLEGRCHVVMIACVAPSNICYEESHNTLKYANRAKNIPVSAEANVTKYEKTVKEYEISQNQSMLEDSTSFRVPRSNNNNIINNNNNNNTTTSMKRGFIPASSNDLSPLPENKRRRASLSVASNTLHKSKNNENEALQTANDCQNLRLSTKISPEERERIKKAMLGYKEETDNLAKEKKNMEEKLKMAQMIISKKDAELAKLRSEVVVLRRQSLPSSLSLSDEIFQSSKENFHSFSNDASQNKDKKEKENNTSPTKKVITPKRRHSEVGGFDDYSPPFKKKVFTPIAEEREEALERILTPAVASRLLKPANELSSLFENVSQENQIPDVPVLKSGKKNKTPLPKPKLCLKSPKIFYNTRSAKKLNL